MTDSAGCDYTRGRRDLREIGELPGILSRVRAVVFDLDGTLVDSVGNIIACARQAFARLNLPAPADHLIMATIGMTLEDGLTSLLPKEQKMRGGELTAAYRGVFVATPQYMNAALFTGAEELAALLRERGYKVGYASGRSEEGVRRTLDGTRLGLHCDAIASGSEAPSKPDPAMMFKICECLSLAPHEVLGVGDSGLDIMMYHEAGSPALGVQSGVWSGEALLALEKPPEILLKEVSELLCYLKNGSLPA